MHERLPFNHPCDLDFALLTEPNCEREKSLRKKEKRLCSKITTISTKNYSQGIYEAEMLSNRLVLRRFATDETAIKIMAVELSERCGRLENAAKGMKRDLVVVISRTKPH